MKYLRAKIKTKYDLFTLFFAIVCLLQLGLIVYHNIFRLQYHLGLDPSIEFLQSIEMWKQKKLLLDNWQITTNVTLATSKPIAALLYGLIGNIFVAYGISNLLIFFLILLVLYKLMDRIYIIPLGWLERLIVFALILCPYIISSDADYTSLCYANCVYIQAAYYNVRILSALLTVYIIVYMNMDNRIPWFLIGISTVISFGTGIFSFVTITFPCFVYLLLRAFKKNTFRFCIGQLFFLGLQTVSVIAGELYIKLHTEYETKSTSMVWIGLTDLWGNICSVGSGFLKLVGALPDDSVVKVFSKDSVGYIFGLSIVLLCIVAVLFFLRYARKNEEAFSNYFLLVCIVVINILIYSLIDSRYGDSVFESRYLIPSYFMIVLIVGWFISYLSPELLLKKFVIIACAVIIPMYMIYSDALLYRTASDTGRLNTIQEFVESTGVGLVYFYNGDMNWECYSMRVYDEDRVYKSVSDDGIFHWGDYKRYDEAGEYRGEYLVFTLTPDELPNRYKKSLTSLGQVLEYYVFIGSDTPFDYKSGITESAVNIDYPYSPSVTTNNVETNELDEYITNGTEGFVLFGPNSKAEKTTYRFTLEYEVIESKEDDAGKFEIVLNEASLLSSVPIKKGKGTVEINNVEISDENSYLAYRISVNEGTKLKINRIIIEDLDRLN